MFLSASALSAPAHRILRPVGLNCLLYKTEKDLEWMSSELGLKKDSATMAATGAPSAGRKSTAICGTRRNSTTTTISKRAAALYTLTRRLFILSGWALPQRPGAGEAVVENLRAFEQPGGIVMSMKDTGAQWDYPYGWAPIQLIAIEGLRRYGYEAEANRISLEFLSMVLDNYPARWNHPREIQRRDAVLGDANPGGIQGKRGRVWMDERSLSDALRRAAENPADETGSQAIPIAGKRATFRQHDRIPAL